MSHSLKKDAMHSSDEVDDKMFPYSSDGDCAQTEGLATTRNDSQVEPSTSETTPLFQDDSRSREYNSATSAMYSLTFFAALGGFLFGYDTGVISGALLPITRLFHLNDLWKEVIVSSTVGAAIFGAVSGGWFNDKFGRKLVLITSSVIFVAGAVLMAVASNKELLMIGRLVVGVAIGYTSTTCPLYVAECAPANIRGKLITIYQMFITLGMCFAAVLDGIFSKDKEDGWRYMLGIGALPGIIMFIGLFFMPESPRYLVQKGKIAEAENVLRKLRGTASVEEELDAIINTCELNASHEKENVFKTIARFLKTSSTRRAVIVGCGLQAIQQLSGINTVMYYSATIISLAGIEDEQTAIWYAAIVAAGNVVFTFFALFVVERAGRRKMTLASLFGIVVSLCLLAGTFVLVKNESPKAVIAYHGDRCSRMNTCYDCIEDVKCGFCYQSPKEGLYNNGSCLSFKSSSLPPMHCNSTLSHWSKNSCPTSYAWLAVVSMILYLAAFAPGMGPMPWAINAEIYPLWARSIGTSFSTSTNWFFNLLVAQTFLDVINLLSRSGAFLFYAGLSVLGLIFVALLLPETKGKSLEDIEELFKGDVIAWRKAKE